MDIDFDGAQDLKKNFDDQTKEMNKERLLNPKGRDASRNGWTMETILETMNLRKLN
jgi:hypothetical protein